MKDEWDGVQTHEHICTECGKPFQCSERCEGRAKSRCMPCYILAVAGKSGTTSVPDSNRRTRTPSHALAGNKKGTLDQADHVHFCRICEQVMNCNCKHPEKKRVHKSCADNDTLTP